jgi:PAS domain S-box-containing protein
LKRTTLSERALVLAPRGRDAVIARNMLVEAGIEAASCASLTELIAALDAGAGFVLVTEEAIATADLHPLAAWIDDQQEWSDLPFILLTRGGAGGLERNPAAGRYLDILRNVTFLERPFHPTTLISLARSATRARRRQYEARARLESLRESEQQFRTLAETMPTLCWMAEPDGHIFWYNRQWYDYTGTEPADMAGWGWQSVHDPDVLPEVMERWTASIATGEAFEMVFPLRSASGEFQPFLTRVQPLRDASGAVSRWFGTNANIAAQLRAEEALREQAADLEQRVAERTAEREVALAQLHEAQKLETLGQLTGGVAHDVNNLLTPITGALDLLNRKYSPGDARTARLIDGALQSAERAKILVNRLLGFARRQTLETRPVDIPGLIEGMRDLVVSSIGQSIELRMVAPADLPWAKADPNQLELALLNLCVNSRDAMPGGGVLTVAAEHAVIGPGGGPNLRPGAYVRLSVIDSGEGMDEATLARAIEPFFSTKGVGKGTGLGLSMVHGLAAQLGGAFTMSSAPGQGTRADLYLPVADAPAQQAPRTSATAAKALRSLTLLLVDDEDLVRTGTAEMLRDLGHIVHEANGGVQALRQLAANREIEAVVTDYMMPRMNGAELAARIAELYPTLPLLVVTGYAGGDLDLNLPQLAKPFRQADLSAALERVVAGGGASNVVRLRPAGG